MYPSVNTALLRKEAMVGEWADNITGIRMWLSDLLTSLDPDLDNGPESCHVLQKNHPTGCWAHVHLHTRTDTHDLTITDTDNQEWDS